MNRIYTEFHGGITEVHGVIKKQKPIGKDTTKLCSSITANRIMKASFQIHIAVMDTGFCLNKSTLCDSVRTLINSVSRKIMRFFCTIEIGFRCPDQKYL